MPRLVSSLCSGDNLLLPSVGMQMPTHLPTDTLFWFLLFCLQAHCSHESLPVSPVLPGTGDSPHTLLSLQEHDRCPMDTVPSPCHAAYSQTFERRESVSVSSLVKQEQFIGGGG